MRERTIENLLLKSFETIQLFPEEVAVLEQLLTETKNNWSFKQLELIRANKMQLARISEKLERLTDCYIEQGLDKETFEKRKTVLLIEIKQNENAQLNLQHGKDAILLQTQNFFELSKSVIKSYEIAIMEKKRRLIEKVTSNLEVEGKKLIISMRSPFLEMSKRWDISSGAPGRIRTFVG